MTKPVFGATLAFSLVLAAVSPRVFAQATEAEMKTFPIPPAKGYAEQKEFAYVGDFGYFVTPLWAVPGAGATANDYNYVRYTGVAGKRVFLYGTWGTTEVPPPVFDPVRNEWRDACGHAHSSYGVWARNRIRIPLGGTIYFWTFMGGGAMSGVRENGRCVVRVNNPLNQIDPRYGWGREFLEIDLRQKTNVTELVIGVLSNTHGWGSCDMPGFKACIEPSWSIGYTLP